MIATIKSPLIPTLFKQKIVEGNDKKVGYLKRAKLTHMLIGHESYQIKYKGIIVKLIERKKIIGRREWDLIKIEKGTEKNIGSFKMLSSTKDTFSKYHTEFQLKYNEELFSINKPYLKRNYCELLSDEGEKKATHLRQNFLKLRRDIRLEGSSQSTIKNAIFILTLSLTIFIA